MRLISNIKELEGKTIKRAVFVDYESMVILTFTDNSYCGIDGNGDMYLTDSEENIDDDMFRDAGIITEKEYKKRKNAETKMDLEFREATDRATYERLKAKYGDE